MIESFSDSPWLELCLIICEGLDYGTVLRYLFIYVNIHLMAVSTNLDVWSITSFTPGQLTIGKSAEQIPAA